MISTSVTNAKTLSRLACPMSAEVLCRSKLRAGRHVRVFGAAAAAAFVGYTLTFRVPGTLLSMDPAVPRVVREGAS